MVDLREEMKSIPENIEEYIANEIKDNCSDEFIVNRLGNFGIKEEDAILLIKKVKKEKKVNNEQSYFDDAETGKIHGWLLFILVLMGVGCIYSFVTNWVVSVEVMNSWVWGILVSLFQLILPILVIIRVVQKKPDGIFLLKSYFIILIIETSISLFFEGPSMIVRLVFQILMLVYLCLSTQVEELFPKEKRKVRYYDWIIVGIYAFFWLFLLLLIDICMELVD